MHPVGLFDHQTNSTKLHLNQNHVMLRIKRNFDPSTREVEPWCVAPDVVFNRIKSFAAAKLGGAMWVCVNARLYQYLCFIGAFFYVLPHFSQGKASYCWYYLGVLFCETPLMWQNTSHSWCFSQGLLFVVGDRCTVVTGAACRSPNYRCRRAGVRLWVWRSRGHRGQGQRTRRRSRPNLETAVPRLLGIKYSPRRKVS